MKKAILATNNSHKVSEFRRAFAESGIDIELLTLREVGFCSEIIEDADTFEGNAFIKASTVAKACNMTAIADDSGLVVDFLNGAPGVFSARYAGENADDDKNNQKLLAELSGVPFEKRTARFVCTICVCNPDGNHFFATGTGEGMILDTARGDNKFGYDPLFFCPPLNMTYAELDESTKNSVSHRGNAIRILAKKLASDEGNFA